MKKYLITILVLTILTSLSAQDIIVFRSGEEKEVIVKKVGTSTIEYLRYDNLEGAIYEVLKDDILSIKYENGVEDIFKLTDKEPFKENQEKFLDSRDSTYYQFLQIGNQIWMGENLRYISGKSPCMQNSNRECEEPVLKE